MRLLLTLALLAATGGSSVSICLGQDKGVSASDDVRAANQACQLNTPR